MGNFFTRLTALFDDWGKGDPMRILLLGLDAAGKTTILYKVKLNEQVSTIPTIGFNVEEVTPIKGVHFVVWDVGGQEKIRPLWQHYFQNSQGLLFVVDSNDRTRFAEARDELFGILEDDRMRGVPLVVMANKQDLPHAASITQMCEALQLNKLSARGHKWHIQSTVATSGDGLFESMEIMGKMAREFSKSSRN